MTSQVPPFLDKNARRAPTASEIEGKMQHKEANPTLDAFQSEAELVRWCTALGKTKEVQCIMKARFNNERNGPQDHRDYRTSIPVHDRVPLAWRHDVQDSPKGYWGLESPASPLMIHGNTENEEATQAKTDTVDIKPPGEKYQIDSREVAKSVLNVVAPAR
jgi:hypothetical protein